MAELSTIARPYAEAYFASAQEVGAAAKWLELAEDMAAVTSHPEVKQLVNDPNVAVPQIFDLLAGLLKAPLPPVVANFLRTLTENGRLAALPEVARQVRQMKNEAEGVADCLIETAFPLSDGDLDNLLSSMSRKFGLKLKPEVRVDPSLIGGVRVTVGDHVLDTSVKSRLAEMRIALTAA